MPHTSTRAVLPAALAVVALLATSGCIVQRPAPCAGTAVDEGRHTFCVIIEKGFLDAECPSSAPTRHEFEDALVCAPADATPADAAVARAVVLPGPDEGAGDDAGLADGEVWGDGGSRPPRPDAMPEPEPLEPGSGAAHPTCATAPPDELPPVVYTRVEGSDRPTFDLWRDIDCAELPPLDGPLTLEDGIPCQGSHGNPCDSRCLAADDEVAGICGHADWDVWCEGQAPVAGFGDACWMCMAPTMHARACCMGLAGFDCRPWPFPADGAAGTVCARHADCEPGLVCSPPRGRGYGICACPEDHTARHEPVRECYR